MVLACRLVRIALILFGLCGPATAEPRRPARCAHTLQERVRVRLVVPEGLAPVAGSIVPVVERVWTPAGLAFEWLPAVEGGDVHRVDLFIYLQEPPIAGAPRNTLGAVQFSAGQPSRVVRVSTSAIRQWASARMAAVTAQPREPLLLNLDLVREKLEHALARVVAHEIGHVILASGDHSGEGVMSRNFTALLLKREIDREAHLDTPTRERLRARLAGTASCGS